MLDPLVRRERFLAGHRPLDLARMEAAAAHMTGYIDCACFANRRPGEPPPVDTPAEQTSRQVRSITIVDEGNGHVRLEFHVRSALYKMVRALLSPSTALCRRLPCASDLPAISVGR